MFQIGLTAPQYHHLPEKTKAGLVSLHELRQKPGFLKGSRDTSGSATSETAVTQLEPGTLLPFAPSPDTVTGVLLPTDEVRQLRHVVSSIHKV